MMGKMIFMSMQEEQEYLKEKKYLSQGYEAGIKAAAEHIRKVDIFDNNGIADSVLQLLDVNKD